MENVAVFRKNRWYSCLVCNCKDDSKLQNITLKRHCHSSSIIAFDVCDDCLKQIREDIENYLK